MWGEGLYTVTESWQHAREVETVHWLLRSRLALSEMEARPALAQQQGRFPTFAVVDALTSLSAERKFAGERLEADQKAAALAGARKGSSQAAERFHADGS
ncbi:MAG: hypothetical protein R6U98_03435 [Pirellulaceae bacterium]